MEKLLFVTSSNCSFLLIKDDDICISDAAQTYRMLIVMCVVNQHITYPYIKNSSINSNVVDY